MLIECFSAKMPLHLSLHFILSAPFYKQELLFPFCKWETRLRSKRETQNSKRQDNSLSDVSKRNSISVILSCPLNPGTLLYYLPCYLEIGFLTEPGARMVAANSTDVLVCTPIYPQRSANSCMWPCPALHVCLSCELRPSRLHSKHCYVLSHLFWALLRNLDALA